MLKIDYIVSLGSISDPSIIVQPSRHQVDVALKQHYNTQVYFGPFTDLLDLMYSIDFMIEGPAPVLEDIEIIESNLCDIWAQNSSKYWLKYFEIITSD